MKGLFLSFLKYCLYSKNVNSYAVTLNCPHQLLFARSIKFITEPPRDGGGHYTTHIQLFLICFLVLNRTTRQRGKTYKFSFRKVLLLVYLVLTLG
jgi:hypothetical protein